jgi:hypothetical protein
VKPECLIPKQRFCIATVRKSQQKFSHWRVGKNPSEKEAMMMTLGELLQQLCTKTPLGTLHFSGLNAVPLPSSPDCLRHSSDFYKLIWATISFQAALSTDLSNYGACVFGEWLANSCTEQTLWFVHLGGGHPLWAADKNAVLRDISRLDAAFGQAACGNPTMVFRLYLLPSWDALTKHLPQIQCGVAAAFKEAKKLGGV